MECRFFLKLLQYKRSLYLVYLKLLIFKAEHFLSPANH
jgi:hypothetical protein